MRSFVEDSEVVKDDSGLITSRTPEDLLLFNKAILEAYLKLFIKVIEDKLIIKRLLQEKNLWRAFLFEANKKLLNNRLTTQSASLNFFYYSFNMHNERKFFNRKTVRIVGNWKFSNFF